MKCKHCNAPVRVYSAACEYCGALRYQPKPPPDPYNTDLFARCSSLTNGIFVTAAKWNRRVS